MLDARVYRKIDLFIIYLLYIKTNIQSWPSSLAQSQQLSLVHVIIPDFCQRGPSLIYKLGPQFYIVRPSLDLAYLALYYVHALFITKQHLVVRVCVCRSLVHVKIGVKIQKELERNIIRSQCFRKSGCYDAPRLNATTFMFHVIYGSKQKRENKKSFARNKKLMGPSHIVTQ